jgi:hypothetical protein
MKQLLAAILLVAAASAQSFYNMNGLGENSPLSDARANSLAGPAALSLANPGVLVNLGQTSFTASALVGSAFGSGQGKTRITADARPAAFHAAIPLPLGTRLSLGLGEEFNQNFNVWSESAPDTAYRRHVIGRGGVYALKVGAAKSFWNAVCIGAEYDHLLGGSREDWRFELADGNYSSTDTIELNYAANTVRVGASYQGRAFSLGLLYEPALTMSAKSLRHVHGVVSDSDAAHTISLPHVLSASAGVNPTQRLSFVAGLTLRPWQEATITDDDATSSLGFRNTWRGSIGAEYDVVEGYPARLGFSHQDWYCNAVGSTAVTENGIHLGTSLPVPKFGSLDASAEVLLRSSSGLSEVAGRLMLTLSYREAWTKRVRHWGY